MKALDYRTGMCHGRNLNDETCEEHKFYRNFTSKVTASINVVQREEPQNLPSMAALIEQCLTKSHFFEVVHMKFEKTKVKQLGVQ